MLPKLKRKTDHTLVNLNDVAVTPTVMASTVAPAQATTSSVHLFAHSMLALPKEELAMPCQLGMSVFLLGCEPGRGRLL
jgi:hypothetical protein